MDDSVAELDTHKILKSPALIIAELKEEAAKSGKQQSTEHSVVVHVPLPKSMYDGEACQRLTAINGEGAHEVMVDQLTRLGFAHA